MKVNHIAVAWVAGMTLIGCEVGSMDGSQTQNAIRPRDTVISGASVRVRDSADVHLIETVRAAWEQTDGDVTIGTAARFRVGSVLDEQTLLSDVSGVAIDQSGNVIVGNAGFAQVKAFSADGELLWTQGSGGGGPGEYQGITDVMSCGEYLVVTDLTGRRVTFLSETGELENTRRWMGVRNGTGPQAFRCNDRGSFAQLDRQGGVPDQVGPYSTNAVISVGSLPNGTGKIVVKTPTIDRYRYNESTAGPAFLGTATYIALGDSLLHVVVSDWPEVRSYTLDGELVRIARWPAEIRQVTDDFIQAEGRARAKVLLDPMEDDYQKLWESWQHPEDLPVSDAVLMAESGEIWVRRYTAWSDRGELTRWWVLSKKGALLGSVVVPRNFELVRVLNSAVVGLTRDSLDVEYVEIREIFRESS